MATDNRFGYPAWRLPGMLRRKRIMRAVLVRTGIMSALRVLSAPGHRIEVTRHEVSAPVRAPITIAHISDPHLTEVGRFENSIFETLEREKPDLIAVTGDVATLGGTDAVYREALARLHAPRGVWVILGNWDYWAGMGDPRALCATAGARLLLDESAELEPGVWITGFDDAVAGHPDAERALASVPSDAYVLALFHCPVYFDVIAGRFGLGLAGHTHGGQVRIPGLPALYMPAGCRPYIEGWYSRAGSRMYVSRGLAAPGIPVRLFCRPEIPIITLVPNR